MGEDRNEYGRINDLAYTSAHGGTRSLPVRRSNAEKEAEKVQRGKARGLAHKARAVQKKKTVIDSIPSKEEPRGANIQMVHHDSDPAQLELPLVG